MIPIRLYAYAAALLLAVAGVWYYGHTRYNAGVAHQAAIAAEQAAWAAADEQKLTAAGDAGAKAATDKGNAQVADNAAQTQTVVRTVTKVIHDSPSPVQCVLPAGSLRTLQDAATSANATAASVVQRASTR